MCFVFGLLGNNLEEGWNSTKVSWVVCLTNWCGVKCSWDSFGWDKVPTCVGALKGIGKPMGKLGTLKNSWLGCLGFHSLCTIFFGWDINMVGKVSDCMGLKNQLAMKRLVDSWEKKPQNVDSWKSIEYVL